MKTMMLTLISWVLASNVWAYTENANLSTPLPPSSVAPGYPSTTNGIFSFDINLILSGAPNGDIASELVPYLHLSTSEGYEWKYHPCRGGRGGGCSPEYLTATASTNASYQSSNVFQSGEAIDVKFQFSYSGDLKFAVATSNLANSDNYQIKLFDADKHIIDMDSDLNGTYTLEITDQHFITSQAITISTTSVPLPAAPWIMLAGILFILRLTRNSRF